MKSERETLEISGLTKLDRLELEKLISPENVAFEASEIDDSLHGEISTLTAIVILTPAVLGAIGLWITRNRRKLVIKQQKESIGKNGEVKREITEINLDSTETNSDVVKEIGKVFKIDSAAIKAIHEPN
jgi:hypothetical protein